MRRPVTRRRFLFWSTGSFAGVTLLVWLYSLSAQLTIYNPGARAKPGGVYINRGRLFVYYSEPGQGGFLPPQRTSFLGFTYEHAQSIWAGGPRNGRTVELHTFSLRLVTLFLLFTAYPVIALVLVPFRTVRRRTRRQCHHCCYSLVGNESGICPECGRTTDGWIVPAWQRLVIAALCIMATGWILEFVIDQTALEHRVSVRFFQWLGDDSGAWLVVSTLRSLVSAAAGIGVYIYLSPERFAGRQ